MFITRLTTVALTLRSCHGLWLFNGTMDENTTTEIQRRASIGDRKAECQLCCRCMCGLNCTELADKEVNLRQVLPPMARPHSAVDTIPVRHLHQSIGKSKKPIVVVRWTPEGRRLLTGGHTGEFMLWNGTAFNFETVMDVRIYNLCGLHLY